MVKSSLKDTQSLPFTSAVDFFHSLCNQLFVLGFNWGRVYSSCEALVFNHPPPRCFVLSCCGRGKRHCDVYFYLYYCNSTVWGLKVTYRKWEVSEAFVNPATSLNPKYLEDYFYSSGGYNQLGVFGSIFHLLSFSLLFSLHIINTKYWMTAKLKNNL